MLRTLSKSVTAGLLAITIAATGITASASPAAANGHRDRGAEAAAVFGGLLLLYGLSQAGRNNQGHVNVRPRHGHGHGHGHVNVRPHNNHVPHINRNARILPSRCYVEGHHNGRGYRGYLRRCTQNRVAAPHLLPHNCLRHVWTDRGHRQIYANRCLHRNGWSRG